jgi:hypothetical protein
MMLKPLPLIVPENIMEQLIHQIPRLEFKLAITQPTGNFFYDPWIMKEDYLGTVWEEVISMLPGPIGEARLIKLEPEQAYTSHADIDDRWHLNIQADKAYLIDLEKEQMHKIVTDRVWYDMDAGPIHTAANFGSYPRIQLVVRKLLLKNQLIAPVKVLVKPKTVDKFRHKFDNLVSTWLNRANKNSWIANFQFTGTEVSFECEAGKVSELLILLNQLDCHSSISM